jgi:tripartite ATP-independent transporter DctP family solute receptor
MKTINAGGGSWRPKSCEQTMKKIVARTLPALAAVFALAVTPGATQQARAQSPTLLRLSNQLPATAAVTKGLEFWKNKVEAATAGRLKVQIYSNSQLYKDNEVFPAVQGGEVDMGLVVSAQFTAYDPVFAIFDLPGLFKTYDQATAAVHGTTGAVLTDHLHKLGVHPLYWPQQGFSAIATSKTALNTPADFKRLKLRAHSKDLARMFQLLGASPTVIAPSEVTTAASRGTIDGLSTSLSSYYARKWFEASPYINNSGFGLIGTVVIINKGVWDKFPDDVKSAIEQASKEAEEFSTKSIVGEEEALLKDLAQKGVHVTVFDDQSAKDFAKIVRPMYDEYLASAGSDGKTVLENSGQP